jgi:hypothetical protein
MIGVRRMRAKIQQIYPPFSEAMPFEWASVAIGLSEAKVVGLPKGQYSVGDEIQLTPDFLGVEADGLLTAMALELYVSGAFSVSDAPTLFGHDAKIATGYSPSEFHDETKQAYLSKIFELMSTVGDLQIYDDGVGYSLGAATEWNAFELVELGHLIADFQWKQRHEASALKGGELTENQKFGLRIASQERRRIGSETRRLVREIADRLLFGDPGLRRNRSELARRIKAETRTPGWIEANGSADWSLSHIRRILRDFD